MQHTYHAYGERITMGTVGQRIRLLRKKLGFSQQDFATRLDIRPATVSTWENDHSVPSVGTLRLISDLTENPNRTHVWLQHGAEEQRGFGDLLATLQGMPYTAAGPEDSDQFLVLLDRLVERSTHISGLVRLMAADCDEQFDLPGARARLEVVADLIQLMNEQLAEVRKEVAEH